MLTFTCAQTRSSDICCFETPSSGASPPRAARTRRTSRGWSRSYGYRISVVNVGNFRLEFNLPCCVLLVIILHSNVYIPVDIPGSHIPSCKIVQTRSLNRHTQTRQTVKGTCAKSYTRTRRLSTAHAGVDLRAALLAGASAHDSFSFCTVVCGAAKSPHAEPSGDPAIDLLRFDLGTHGRRR